MSKPCRTCHNLLPIEAFYHATDTVDGRQSQCRQCANAAQNQRRRGRKRKGYHSHASQLISEARKRARAKGIECTIELADIIIPTVCPCLGIPLARGTGSAIPASPSIDRIDPRRGYVPGNVWVISRRANLIKNDATPTELEAVAMAIRKLNH